MRKPLAIMIAGLPGTGKSTLASALAGRLNISHLNTDRVRKEMGKTGQYQPEDKEAVYREMLTRVKNVLQGGKSVVVDATFARAIDRKAFREAVNGFDLEIVEVTCAEEIALERVRRPRPDSEADEQVYALVRDRFEPIRETHIEIDSGHRTAAQMVDETILRSPLIAGMEEDGPEVIDLPEKPARILETHISRVVVAPPFAYKIKKPVHFSFLDFRNVEARKHFCYEEVRLNRRLAPDIYLGVVAIRDKKGSRPETWDYAVKMKAMDPDLHMRDLLEKGEVTEDQVRKIASKVAHFHADAEKIYEGQDAASLESRFGNITGAVEAASGWLSHGQKNKVSSALRKAHVFLEERKDLVLERRRQGWVRDVHGDLHSGNIFLYDDPVIFDCIEFEPDFRRIDVLNEIAFFCMDMESFDRHDLAETFLDTYLDILPAMPENSRSLFHYFKAYRANVRAKVQLLRAAQSQDHASGKIIADAERYLDLMHAYMRQVPNSEE